MPGTVSLYESCTSTRYGLWVCWVLTCAERTAQREGHPLNLRWEWSPAAPCRVTGVTSSRARTRVGAVDVQIHGFAGCSFWVSSWECSNAICNLLMLWWLLLFSHDLVLRYCLKWGWSTCKNLASGIRIVFVVLGRRRILDGKPGKPGGFPAGREPCSYYCGLHRARKEYSWSSAIYI